MRKRKASRLRGKTKTQGMLRPGRAGSSSYMRKQQQLFGSWLKAGLNNNIVCRENNSGQKKGSKIKKWDFICCILFLFFSSLCEAVFALL